MTELMLGSRSVTYAGTVLGGGEDVSEIQVARSHFPEAWGQGDLNGSHKAWREE